MPGTRKSGGRATTAAAKEVKARGAAAREKKRAAALPEPPPGGDPLSDDPVRRLGRPVSWGDELKRQQVEGEKIQNRRRAVEVERAQVELQNAKEAAALERGRTLTLEQVRDRDQSRLDLVLEHVGILVDAAVALHQPERQPAARHEMDLAVRAFRTAVAAGITGKR